jgi:uncharacterized membrane protein YfcA
MALFGRSSERDEVRAASYAAWFQRQHPLALPSLLLSAFSLTHAGTLWVDEIAGIVLGVVALRQIARARTADDAPDAQRTAGQWLAWGGVVVGVISLLLAFVIYFVLPRRG